MGKLVWENKQQQKPAKLLIINTHLVRMQNGIYFMFSVESDCPGSFPIDFFQNKESQKLTKTYTSDLKIN